jgi:hypothetical protein
MFYLSGFSLEWEYVLVTDTRILLKETVEPGGHYIVEGYGDLGKTNKHHWCANTLMAETCCKRFIGTLQITLWAEMAVLL